MVKVSGEKPGTQPAKPGKEQKPVDPNEPQNPTPEVPAEPLTEPADAPADPPPDPLQAVDFGGRVINIGDYVDLYFCKVVGFKPDENNRLNIWVVPTLNTIKTNDPNNPLTGQLDEKAMLVSGYSTVSYAPPSGNPSSLSAPAEAIMALAANIQKSKDVADGTAPAPVLPSNFLAPSII